MKNVNRITIAFVAVAVSMGMVSPAMAQSYIPRVDVSAIQGVVPDHIVHNVDSQINGMVDQANHAINQTVNIVPNVQNSINASIANVANTSSSSGAQIPSVPNLPNTPSPAPGSTAKDAQVSNDTVNKINAHRIARGLRPLIVDPVLSSQAQGWANHMRDYNDWSFSPDNTYQAVSVSSHTTSDYLYSTWSNTSAVNNPHITRIGVGVSTSTTGTTYANLQTK